MKRIPPFRLIPEPLTEEAAQLPPFRWAGGEVGGRFRLGGEPDGIEEQHRPRCPECSEEMTFYAQLDSLNDEFVIADCGLIYVFVCFDCIEVETLVVSP